MCHYWKIQLLGEEFTKKQYRGGDCLKRGGLGQFADLGGVGGRGGGGCAWQEIGGVDTPRYIMDIRWMILALKKQLNM